MIGGTDRLRLPKDLIAFLAAGKQLEYDAQKCEPGRITLLPLGEHALGYVWLDSENHPYIHTDPHAGEKGYYAIPAVNLVKTAEGFDPSYILLWLPEWNLYGTWDSDHWDLLIFPNATWSQIASSPLDYINAQWYSSKVENELFVPWLTYPFKYQFNKGWPFQAKSRSLPFQIGKSYTPIITLASLAAWLLKSRTLARRNGSETTSLPATVLSRFLGEIYSALGLSPARVQGQGSVMAP